MDRAATDENRINAGTFRPLRRALRVFLVEDAPVVRSLIIECIEEIAGLEVAGFAGSEESALSWLRSHPCDVLILDVELRHGSGLGVLKALAAFDPPPRLVKIVYSNHANEIIRRVAAQFGVSHFFDKTLDADKLRLLLQEIAVSET